LARTLTITTVSGALFVLLLAGGWAHAQATDPQPLVLERDGSTIVLEPYAPNIVRVTLSLDRKEALAAPGYGFVAAPAGQGWAREKTADSDIYRSPRMVVTVAVNKPVTPTSRASSAARRPGRTSPSAPRRAGSCCT
jgi:hypothetical protein